MITQYLFSQQWSKGEKLQQVWLNECYKQIVFVCGEWVGGWGWDRQPKGDEGNYEYKLFLILMFQKELELFKYCFQPSRVTHVKHAVETWQKLFLVSKYVSI